MIRYGIRLMSQGKVLNPHSFIIREIQKNQGNIPMASVSNITQMLTSHEDLKDKLFISSLVEIANFSAFKPFFIQIKPRLESHLSFFSHQDLVKLAQALNKLGLLDEKSIEAISEQILKNISILNLHEIGSILYSFHKFKANHGILINKLTEKAFILIESASKADLLKIFKSFSFYPETFFNKKAFIMVEKISESLSNSEKIDFMEQVWKCGTHAGSLEFHFFSSLNSLSDEEYAKLVNQSSRYNELLAQYREKLLKNLETRDLSNFSSESVLFIVNGLHEFDRGREVCKYFELFVEENMEKLEPKHLYLLMYVMGIKGFIHRAGWRKFDSIVRKNLQKMTHLEKIWSIYALFKVGRLKVNLFQVVLDSLDDQEWCAKSMEKVFEIAENLNNKSTITRLLPFFIVKHKDFLGNKGLICLNSIEKAGLMTPELYKILKYYKTLTKDNN